MLRKPADEHYVFVVSDADLARYGISPASWNKILMQDAAGIYHNQLDQFPIVQASLRAQVGPCVLSLKKTTSLVGFVGRCLGVEGRYWVLPP